MMGGSQLSSPCPSIPTLQASITEQTRAFGHPDSPPAKLSKTPIRTNSTAFCL